MKNVKNLKGQGERKTKSDDKTRNPDAAKSTTAQRTQGQQSKHRLASTTPLRSHSPQGAQKGEGIRLKEKRSPVAQRPLHLPHGRATETPAAAWHKRVRSRCPGSRPLQKRRNRVDKAEVWRQPSTTEGSMQTKGIAASQGKS